MNLKNRLFVILSIIICISSIYTTTYSKEEALPTNPPSITVWVHGTRNSERIGERISNPLLQAALRPLTTAMHNLGFCPPGLHLAKNIDKKYHMHTIAQVLNTSAPEQFPINSFYVFGWSGALSPVERKDAGKTLHKALKELSQEYIKTHGIAPQITLITHSHGGNVALNMGMLESTTHPSFSIKRLILLACPVQIETAPGIDSPLFEKTYSMHSHIDNIQIADPQGLTALKNALKKTIASNYSLESLQDLFYGEQDQPIFSERHFKITSNLDQVRIRWQKTYPWDDNDFAVYSHAKLFIKFIMKPYLAFMPKERDLLHVEFTLPSFLKQLPRILCNIEKTRNTSIKTSVDSIVYI